MARQRPCATVDFAAAAEALMRYATWFDKMVGGASASQPSGLPPPPFRRPGKIICVGVNYPERNAEYKDGSEAPKYPSLFVRFPGSFVGHEQPIVRPAESVQFDYEGEIALVIGKPGRRIPEANAREHVFGLTLILTKALTGK